MILQRNKNFVLITIALVFNLLSVNSWAGHCETGISTLGEPTFCHGTTATLSIWNSGPANATVLDWYKDGVLIAENIGNMIDVTESGTYKAITKTSYDCGWSGNFTIPVGYSWSIDIEFAADIPNVLIAQSENNLKLSFETIVSNWQQKFTIEWFKDNVAIPNSGVQSIRAFDYGTYKAIVSDQLECSFNSSNEVSIEKSPLTVKNIYPNPATSDVLIEHNCLEIEEGIIQICDNRGAVKYERAINYEIYPDKVDLNNFSSGVYYIKIITPSEKSELKKFVVQ